MSSAAIYSLPCSLNNAARIASRLGIPIRAISLHRFPDEELRVTVGSAAATSIDRRHARPSRRKAARNHVRCRGVAAQWRGAAGPRRAVHVLHASGYCFPRRRSDQPEGDREAVSGDCGPDHNRRRASSPARPISGTCFPASRVTISPLYRQSQSCCAPLD